MCSVKLNQTLSRFLPCVLAAAAAAHAQTTWYVDDDNCPGPGSGAAGDPFCAIQVAIDAAVTPGDTVEVLPGTYYEAIDLMGKAITVVSTSGRDVTTIDATGLGASVVTCASGEGPETVLEGFTITGGSSSYGGGMRNYSSSPTVNTCTFTGNTATNGGGMSNREFSAPTITNCTFSKNSAYYGGGMYNLQNCSPSVIECAFTENTATDDGGGMYNDDGASPTVTRCKFSGNTATGSGGGLYNFVGANATVANCTFTGNMADTGNGGGMANGGGTATVSNCTFIGNTVITGNGGGIRNHDVNPTVTNCILWGNTPDQVAHGGTGTTTVTYSDIQGGFPGTGNIDLDPNLRVSAAGEPRLDCYSPCVDAGNNAAVPGGVITDLDGNARFVDDAGVVDTGAGAPPIVDMGAYERQFDSYAGAKTIYVDDDTCPAHGSGSGVDPYCSIQDALDAACGDGDYILVRPGTYFESVDFQGKALTLASTGGQDVTTIDATSLGSSVVTCASGEGADTVLDGFTITGGTGTDPGDGYLRGGGMYIDASSPTVTNCTLTANTGTFGVGMYNGGGSPTVTSCTFSLNSGHTGGGMFNDGGSPVVSNCLFGQNGVHGIGSTGGGMYNQGGSTPAVTNCKFYSNWGGYGGGGMRNESADPTVTNCTFNGNHGIYWGRAVSNIGSNPTLTNCILWGNTGDGGEIYNSGSSPTVTYSDVQGGYAGTGNIDADPRFRDAASGDLRLDCFSPCVDAGDNIGVPGGVTTDLNGNARLVDDTGVFDTGAGTPPIVDMGAYERQIPSLGTLYVDVANCPGPGSGAPGDPLCSIQDAIDAAGVAKHTVEVAPGTYQEAIDFLGKAITLVSTGGREVTIIDATGLNTSVVTCANGEAPDTVLDGFTITGGTGTMQYGNPYGGGMYNYGASPTVINCTFTGNTAKYGGGMYCRDGSPGVTNCTFTGNTVTMWGGGMANQINGNPAVTNCTFIGNSAGYYGAGMGNGLASPAVSNCTFTGNTAIHSGSGMWNSEGNPTVTNCTFKENTGSFWGGGMSNHQSSSPVVTNCTFTGNSSTYYGGGLYNLQGNPALANCIFWNNVAPVDPEICNDPGSPTVTYSNVEGGTGQPWFGTGCIDLNPLFRNVSTGDLRLQPGSPCVDTGDDTAVPLDTLDVDSDGDTTEPTPDLHGKPRIMDGDGDTTATVDMGAAEYYVDCNENETPDVCDVDCSALGGACNVPGCGLSTECNSNGIPDDCDIADCTSDSPDYPGCDDCNLNQVPDECDIAGTTSNDVNLDQVPDECIRPYTGGVDWSDPIWIPASDDYPDSDPGNPNGIPDQHVVLDAVDLILDVTVAIDTLTVESDASLCMNGGSPCTAAARRNHNLWDEAGAELAVAGTGDLMLADPGGLRIEGTLSVLADRTISESEGNIGAAMTIANYGQLLVQDSTISLSGEMTIKGSGRYTDDPSQLDVNTASLSTHSVLVTGAECAFGANCGTLELIESMTLSVSDGLSIFGMHDFAGFFRTGRTVVDKPLQRAMRIHSCPGAGIVGATVGVTPPPCFAVTGLASANVSGNITLTEATITINESLDNGINLAGDYANYSKFPSLFEWHTGRLAMVGSTVQSFEVAGIDFGQSLEGFRTTEDTLFDTEEHCNFSMGRVEVGVGANVRFVNNFANAVGIGQCQEALYVDSLVLEAGSTVTIEDANVYYNSLTDNGATIRELGCGRLLQMCFASSPPTLQAQFDPAANAGGPEPKNRVLPINAGDAGRSQTICVTWNGIPDWPGGHAALVGQRKFLTAPFQVCESPSDGLAAGPPNCGPAPGQPQKWFWAATLTCDPAVSYFSDLTALTQYCTGSGESCTVDIDCAQGTCGVDGAIHIIDDGIVPSKGIQAAIYHVQVVDETCTLGNEGDYSDPLVVAQPIYGDIGDGVSACPMAPPNGSSDLIPDVTAALATFRNGFCAPKKTRVDMEPQSLDMVINITDILKVLNGFSGMDYDLAAGPACTASRRGD